MTAEPPIPEQDYVYRVEPSTRQISFISVGLMALIFGLIFPLIIVASSRDRPFTPDSLIVAVLPVALVVYTFFSVKRWNRQTWLRITASYIEYHTPGLMITSN